MGYPHGVLTGYSQGTHRVLAGYLQPLELGLRPPALRARLGARRGLEPMHVERAPRLRPERGGRGLQGTRGYPTVLRGTLRYSEVLCGTEGYSAVLRGTLRYSGVL
jgi:hypothetical protein